MAANEVIELDSDSGSSDDEFKDPPRKPIGWNYQCKASKGLKPMTPEKINGTVHNSKKEEENAFEGSDEIEIVELSPVKSESKDTNRVAYIPSYSRSQIRKIIRNTTQSSISSYLTKSDTQETHAETRTDKNVTSVAKNNNTDDDKNTKLKTVSKRETVSKNETVSTNDAKEKVTTKDTGTKEKVPVTTKDTGTRDKVATKDAKETISTKDTKEIVCVKDNKETVTTKENEGDKKENYNEDENSETSISAVESFVSRWEELKSSHDDKKIRDKLWKYYYLAHSSYTHSKKFIKLVEGSTRKLSIDNIYVVVKDLLDFLKCYKDRPYKEKGQKIDGEGSSVASPLPDETEEDKKRNKKLRKVEKKMKEISDKIKELETAEMDLDDEDNSAYLIEDRLKRQFSKLHDYYCKIAECTPATGRPIERKFRYSGSRYEEVNKRISAWVNKTKEFPDYVDILNLLKKVTKESCLPLRPETVRVQAQEIFRDVGRLLKDRRESDDLYSIYSYIEDDGVDPADKDEDLSKKLSENESVAKEKLDKIFQEFVEKEAEAREVADKKSDTKAKETKEGGAASTNQEIEVAAEEQTEEEEEEIDYEVNEAENDSYGEEEEEEEEEEEDDRVPLVTLYTDAKDDEDLGDDTDDELRDVIASASVEEELSEEDVPIIDSEEQKLGEEDDGSSSSIVCLDDTSSDSAVMLDKGAAESFKNENPVPALVIDSSCNKRPFDEDFSPQKRPCVGDSKP